MKTSPLILTGVLAVATASAFADPKEKSFARLPLYCAGIVVGMSTDPDVQRLFGIGYSLPNEGHAGGRYFVDAKGRVTLHVETGVDNVIEAVSYQRGLHVPKGAAATLKAKSTRLTAEEATGNGVRLGKSAEYVRAQFGKPSQEARNGTTRTLRYAADEKTNPYVLVYEAEFRFERERLVGVKLYNGE